MVKYVIKNVEKQLPDVTIFYLSFHVVSPTTNPQVAGSNPAGRTNKIKWLA